MKQLVLFASLIALTALQPSIGQAVESGICSRSSNIQSVILSKLSELDQHVENCKDVNADHLAKITALLVPAASEAPARGDFDGLVNLGSLSLWSQGEIVDGLLDGLKSLKNLTLVTDFEQFLPVGLFNDTVGLDDLHLVLRSGRIRTGTFDKLTELRRLGISAVAIQPELLKNSRKIESISLRLSGTSAQDIDTRFAEGLTELKALRVSSWTQNREKVCIPYPSLKGLSALETLETQNLCATVLTGGQFKDLHKVKSLDLSFHKISEIHGDPFTGMDSLEVLNLNNNRLHGRVSIANLPSLKTLSVSNNEIQSFASTLTSNNPNLESMNLSNNKMNEVAADQFVNNSNLVMLDLSNNALTAIPATAFQGCPQLKYVILDRGNVNASDIQ